MMIGLGVIIGLWVLGAVISAVLRASDGSWRTAEDGLRLLGYGLLWPFLVIGEGVLAAGTLVHRHRFHEPDMVERALGARRRRCICGEIESAK